VSIESAMEVIVTCSK